MLKGTDRLDNRDQAIPSRGETLAPLCAPVRENPAAADGRHALAESVPALADEIAGLEGAFHGLPPSNYEPAVYGFAPAKSTPGAAFQGHRKTGPIRPLPVQGIKFRSHNVDRETAADAKVPVARMEPFTLNDPCPAVLTALRSLSSAPGNNVEGLFPDVPIRRSE